MEIDKTTATLAACVTIGFVALMVMVMIMFGMKNSNEHYFRIAGECIAKGGSWVPTSYGLCIPR
jgi:hypothetical protein